MTSILRRLGFGASGRRLLGASLVAITWSSSANAEVTQNGGFDAGLASWTASTTATYQVLSGVGQGSWASVTNRASLGGGSLRQDLMPVAGTLQKAVYRTSLRVRVAAPAHVQCVLHLGYARHEESIVLAQRTVGVANKWTTVEGIHGVSWLDPLDAATLESRVEQVAPGDALRYPDFDIDDVKLDRDDDADMLSNAEEAVFGTSPSSADTDGDGIDDGWEHSHGLDPLNVLDDFLDLDLDGFSNAEEYAANSDPQSFLQLPGIPTAATIPEAADVLKYLALLPSLGGINQLLAGQHVLQPATSEYQTVIVQPGVTAGKQIGLLSLQYDVPGSSALQTAQVNSSATSFWNGGGLVLIRWSPKNPWSGGSYLSERVIPGGSLDDASVNLTELTVPGTPAYTSFRNSMQSVANALIQLQQSGVVVLFCPLPDATGNSTFWGQRPRQAYVALWQYMFSAFQGWGVNNALWVYEGHLDPFADPLPVDYYYPGDAYVDVFANDFFSDSMKEDADLTRIARAYPKVFGFSMAGPRFPQDGSWDTMAFLDGVGGAGGTRNDYRRASFFVAGSAPVTGQPNYLSLGGNQNFTALLSDPWVVTLDEVSH